MKRRVEEKLKARPQWGRCGALIVDLELEQSCACFNPILSMVLCSRLFFFFLLFFKQGCDRSFVCVGFWAFVFVVVVVVFLFCHRSLELCTTLL